MSATVLTAVASFFEVMLRKDQLAIIINVMIFRFTDKHAGYFRFA